MEEGQLDEAILVALRNSPGSRSEELAEAVDLPRTNFGRRLKHSLREPLERLLAEGSIEKVAAATASPKRGEEDWPPARTALNNAIGWARRSVRQDREAPSATRQVRRTLAWASVPE